MILPNGTVVAFDEAQDVIRAYRHSTIQLYDGSNTGPHDRVLPVDLGAIGALNGFGGAESSATMGALWDIRFEVEILIAHVSAAPLQALSPVQRDQEADKLDAVLAQIQDLAGWGGQGVVASKFLHRLRPNLMPIWDRFAGAYWYAHHVDDPTWKPWLLKTYDRVLENITELTRLQAVASAHFDSFVPLLRVWDIILWAKGRELAAEE